MNYNYNLLIIYKNSINLYLESKFVNRLIAKL